MKSHHIDKVESDTWSANAAKLKQASKLLAQVQVSMFLDFKGKHTKAIDRISKAEEATSGLAYLFTPQTEWTGGDSMDPKNFKVRSPHIVTD